METTEAGTILGVNCRSYPTQLGNTDEWSEHRPIVVVVLVAGAIGDYAAYCGIGSPEWVARHGVKLLYEEACCHFPGGQLQRERYRD